MKKLSFLLFIISLFFVACEPNKDLNDKFDEEQKKKDADFLFFADKTLLENGYTLIEEDFAKSTNEDVAKYKNFSASNEAKDHLPALLDVMKVYGEPGKEYKISFPYYRGYSETYAMYRRKHEVSSAEYKKVGDMYETLGAFTRNNSAMDNIDAILKAAYPDAAKGDVYKMVALETNKDIDALEYLAMDAAEYQIIVDSVKNHDVNDTLVSKYGNSEMYYGANAYFKNFEGRLDKWRDIKAYADMNLDDDDLEDLIYDRQMEAINILLQKKYPNAKMKDASGKDITYVVKYVVYDGASKEKYVRFECTKEGPNPTFNKLGSLYINYKYEFMEFDGTDWKVENDAYRLQTSEYDEMGTDYGYPGKYNNFASDISPDHYLPTWLNNKWKYEKDGTVKVIVYKYYAGSGNTELRADEYTFTKELGWHKTPTTITKSAICAYKDKAWVFVPPIKLVKTEEAATKDKYTLTADDYALVGNGKYKNFDIREGKGEADEAVIIAKLTTILKANFSLAIGDIYEVEYSYYDGAAGTGTIKLKAVADE